jgi:predicted 3-demethylubiquinone-9 3-methyltransferase (glyoxalase superfamily)
MHELFGQMLLRADHPHRAVEQFAVALRRHPNRARALLVSARAHTQTGDTQAAAAGQRALSALAFSSNTRGRNTMQPITPCLWFDHQAKEAAEFYTSIFRNAKIGRIAHYGAAGREVHGQPPGTVMTVAFELNGQPFTALNGGPVFKFNEAISLQVICETQEEIDYYWERLSTGGDENAQQCGWLKDKYGVSWQIIPTALVDMSSDPDPARAGRVMEAILKMKKINLNELKRAYAG